jgi:hypothetical protein
MIFKKVIHFECRSFQNRKNHDDRDGKSELMMLEIILDIQRFKTKMLR